MRIPDILSRGRSLSFEVFPPKPADDADLSGILSTVSALSGARPDFISVTYSPAGKNRDRALQIAEFIRDAGTTPLSHFTAVGSDRPAVDAMLADLEARGVENVLALRGDIPADLPSGASPWKDFRWARDMVAYIRGKSSVAIGGAAYPEGHPENRDVDAGIRHLLEKEKAGADFFITQLFFDNEPFFRFRDAARAAGLRSPILAGIMPVTRARQIRRIVELSGCAVPPSLAALLERWADDDAAMEEAGIDWAAAQIRGLVEGGVDGIHLYTMNRPQASLSILERSGLSRKSA